MSKRRKYWQRCELCKMRQELCICRLLPSVSLATKVIVVGNKRELRVPTNTGRLASQVLRNSVLLSRGDQDHPYDLATHLPTGQQALLLYPADDALVLSPALLGEGPFALVVPDGNWRQTSKMRRRDPVMATLQTVVLPPGPPSRYSVRQESKRGGLATLEAIGRALAIIDPDGRVAQEALEGIFMAMVARTLSSRGQAGRFDSGIGSS